MSLLIKPEPFSREVDRIFDRLFDAPAAQRWAPAMDLTEAEDHYVLKADLPGVSDEDVSIEVDRGVLTVSGERRAEHEQHEKGWHRIERAFGTFQRQLTLPEGVDADAVTAEFDRGVLDRPGAQARAGEAAADRNRRRQRRRQGRRGGHRRGEVASGGMSPPAFEIDARDGSARAGVLRLAHGEVNTPAFVPLASNASVRGLAAAEVEALGFEMVLGNTFHLFIQPGQDYVREMGGLHEFMGWRRPLITDSGGFQVFSMGHGSVAEEVKRRRGQSQSRVISIEEEGVTFRSYVDGDERFMGPETSMEVQAALGSDIALAFDECTPFHSDRDYTRRSMERTHRWLERCKAWHGDHGPTGQALYGIVQGGVHEDLRAESAAFVAAADTGRRGDRRLAGRGQGADARGAALVARPDRPRQPAPPPGDRGRGRHPRRSGRRRRHLRLRDAHPPGPPRHGPRARSRHALPARPLQVSGSRAGRADRRGVPLSGLP